MDIYEVANQNLTKSTDLDPLVSPIISANSGCQTAMVEFATKASLEGFRSTLTVSALQTFQRIVPKTSSSKSSVAPNTVAWPPLQLQAPKRIVVALALLALSPSMDVREEDFGHATAYQNANSAVNSLLRTRSSLCLGALDKSCQESATAVWTGGLCYRARLEAPSSNSLQTAASVNALAQISASMSIGMLETSQMVCDDSEFLQLSPLSLRSVPSIEPTSLRNHSAKDTVKTKMHRRAVRQPWYSRRTNCLDERVLHRMPPRTRTVDCSNSRTTTTAAELFYLRHVRSCAAQASGARTTAKESVQRRLDTSDFMLLVAVGRFMSMSALCVVAFGLSKLSRQVVCSNRCHVNRWLLVIVTHQNLVGAEGGPLFLTAAVGAVTSVASSWIPGSSVGSILWRLASRWGLVVLEDHLRASFQGESVTAPTAEPNQANSLDVTLDATSAAGFAASGSAWWGCLSWLGWVVIIVGFVLTVCCTHRITKAFGKMVDIKIDIHVEAPKLTYPIETVTRVVSSSREFGADLLRKSIRSVGFEFASVSTSFRDTDGCPIGAAFDHAPPIFHSRDIDPSQIRTHTRIPLQFDIGHDDADSHVHDASGGLPASPRPSAHSHGQEMHIADIDDWYDSSTQTNEILPAAPASVHDRFASFELDQLFDAPLPVKECRVIDTNQRCASIISMSEQREDPTSSLTGALALASRGGAGGASGAREVPIETGFLAHLFVHLREEPEGQGSATPSPLLEAHVSNTIGSHAVGPDSFIATHEHIDELPLIPLVREPGIEQESCIEDLESMHTEAPSAVPMPLPQNLSCATSSTCTKPNLETSSQTAQADESQTVFSQASSKNVVGTNVPDAESRLEQATREAETVFKVSNEKQATLHAELAKARALLKTHGRTEPMHVIGFGGKRCQSAERPQKYNLSSDPVRVRPVSVMSSDLCQISSPPSQPSSVNEHEVRQGPTCVATGSLQVSGDSLPRGGASSHARGRPHASAAPIIPLEPPVAYKIEKCARIPIYAEASSSSSASASVPSKSCKAEFVASSAAPPVVPAREPSRTVAPGAPPSFRKCGRPSLKTDPDYPGNDGDEEGQCCQCGVVIPLLHPQTFVCSAFDPDGTDRCLHILCEDCREPGAVLCPCQHFELDGRVVIDEEAFHESNARIQSHAPAPSTNAPQDALVQILNEFKNAIVNQNDSGGQRTMLKTAAVMEFPKGSEEALEDLDSWLTEFDRVVNHIGGPKGLMISDRIAHLLAAWGKDTIVGENMRLDQQTAAYISAERAGDMQTCWDILLTRLNAYRVEPAEARRRAEHLWAALYWPGDLDSFNTLVRRAVLAMRKAHVDLADHTVVFKYLELLPPEKAIALDDPLRRPSMGWTYEGLMAAAKEMFSLEKAYAAASAAGSGIPQRQRQRAAWANDLKMVQAPLGSSTFKSPLARSHGSGGGGVEDKCSLCNGTGHRNAQCPNHKAKKDEAFNKKVGAQKQHPCNKCGGVGHWAKHHQTQQRQVMCKYFQKGLCKAGGSCKFSHSIPLQQNASFTQPQSSSVSSICNSWSRFGFCKRPQGSDPATNGCSFKHPPDKKGPTEEGKQALKKWKGQDCRQWTKGVCKRHEWGACLFKHDPKKKGSQQRSVNIETGEAPTADGGKPAEAIGQKRQLVEACEQPPEVESPPFVYTRPTRICDPDAVQRRQLANDKIYDFNGHKHLLPKRKPPKPGYSWCSTLCPKGLPHVSVKVIWDGGAEGTSISDRGMSRILRAQSEASLPEKDCPMKEMALMDPPQRFFSFSESEGGGTIVDIMGDLVLMVDDGSVLPPLQVRMVPGQVDDLLISAQDLDKFGFDSFSDPEWFLLKRIGLSVRRDVKAHHATTRAVCIGRTAHVKLCDEEIIAPHETRIVEANCFQDDGSSFITESEFWFAGESDDSVIVADGPLSCIERQVRIVLHNSSDDSIVLEQGFVLGHTSQYDEETKLLADSLEQLESSMPLFDDICEEDCETDIRPDDAVMLQASVVDNCQGGSDHASKARRGWSIIVLLLLVPMLRGLSETVFNRKIVCDGFDDDDTCKHAPVVWNDLASASYRDALCVALDEQRESRYSHLSLARFQKLRNLVSTYSHCLVIDGVEPSTVEGYEFDLELMPGAQPVRHQLPKLSPKEQEKERYHVKKAERSGHLRVPTDEQKSEWATRTHIVFKKDDDMGRWICDFRPLNRVTKKRMTALGDVYTKTRRLASRLWKSGLDAWSGFNQLRATERAKRLLQIITSSGLRQWEVLPFGVTNGPSYFQEFMLDLFGGRFKVPKQPLSDLLADGLSDLGGILEVWVDDIQVGTGDAANIEAQPEDGQPDGFDAHLVALERIFERASLANLRFKLSKCFFAQFELETLGMIAACGVMKPDPKKTHAIAVWPRPARLEDVERFLATTVFIREHLSPRYSQISKPLRDSLKTLQEKRRSGQKKGKARYLPLGRTADDQTWPDFWDQSCEESFQCLKQLAINAVELQVPDCDGASDGTNPYHIWPDACAYGIGAGLFQGYSAKATDAPESYYSLLGLNTWVTKAELEGRYRDLKRSRRVHSGSDTEAIDKAFEVLSDTEKRKQYDESLGLATRRKSRVDLRPLGFFSKSLTSAQQSWPTWERELLAVLLCLLHFRTVVAGQDVVIHTDHLNNTVLGERLTSPDKILRMLLKIEGLVKPRWVFAPGSTQCGDGISRNPPDRDEAREKSEGKAHMPSTLADAFSIATRTSLEGQKLMDDTEQFTGQYVNRTLARVQAHTLLDSGDDFDEPVTMQWLKRGAPGRVICRSGRTLDTIAAVLLPSHHGHAESLEALENFKVLGKGIMLATEVVLQPPIVLPTLGRRWLEEYMPAPRNKAIQRKMRNAMLDGILLGLRALVTLASVAVIGLGEGALILMGMLSGEARMAAYKERHVPEQERLSLEDAMESLLYAVLIAPHSYPLKSYMPLLREFVPEICSIVPNCCSSVIVVAPARDALHDVAHECAQGILGSIVETVKFDSPAYRSVPRSPMPLYQLLKVPEPSRLPVETEGRPPREVAETWAVNAALTPELLRFGFVARAYDGTPQVAGTSLPEGHMEHVENQVELEHKIAKRELYQIHVAPDSFSWLSLHGHAACSRTQDMPQGSGILAEERRGNSIMSIALWLIWLCLRHGVFFTFEHPLLSKAWRLPFFRHLIDKMDMCVIDFDQCAWGKRPGDYEVEEGDVRTMSGTRMVTNNPYMKSLAKRCVDVVRHSHRAATGGTATKQCEKHTSVYPRFMAAAYALATRTAWLKNARGEPSALPCIPLTALQADICLDPAARIGPVNRPLAVGGSSSSSSGLAAPSTQPAKLGDHWMETDTQWIRIHEVPRSTFLYPIDVMQGPEEASLQDIRVTQLVYADGCRETKQHNWRDSHSSKAKTRMKWTGRSIFFKKLAPPADTAQLDKTGAAIDPSSPAAFKASLAGLRTQIAKAQRKDPRLAQIISRLRREKAGAYIAEPRGPEHAKIKSRALHYRLTSDDVLVAKDSPDGPGEDRPVIPDTQHEGDIPGAPKNMTWKHLMLAAVHNSTTGQHRRASEMASELQSLVAWWPPEHLMRDCKMWRERCKLCTSVYSKPGHEPPYQAVRSYVPFYRLQIDLVEIKPAGSLGEKYVLTAICVATRYIFLRVTTTRDAPELAQLLLDVILDAGVVPSVVQSDNEFLNLAFEELCTLLGSTQIFSTALRPQSQGIVERSHRDIRSHLAVLIEAYARSNPRKWPSYIRFVEHKLRHRTLVEDITPFSAVHGFRGASALKSALGAITEIPEEIVWADWLRVLVEETKLINATLSEHWHTQAEIRARKHSEQKPEPSLQEGDLVLMTKPFYEKGTGVILPQCDGPFTIYKLPTAHTALLLDTLSGEPAGGGKAVSISRLIRFRFPIEWAGVEAQEMEQNVRSIADLKIGNMVCVAPRTSQYNRIHVARIDKVFREQGLAEVTLFWVPPGNRTGPWQARRWAIWVEDGVIRREVINQDELVCSVSLKDDALTQQSLELLTAHGVPASGQPRRDSTLPPRRA